MQARAGALSKRIERSLECTNFLRHNTIDTCLIFIHETAHCTMKSTSDVEQKTVNIRRWIPSLCTPTFKFTCNPIVHILSRAEQCPNFQKIVVFDSLQLDCESFIRGTRLRTLHPRYPGSYNSIPPDQLPEFDYETRTCERVLKANEGI